MPDTRSPALRVNLLVGICALPTLLPLEERSSTKIKRPNRDSGGIMSKRLLAVSLLLLVLSSAPAAMASPNDDQDPGTVTRIQRVISGFLKSLRARLVPQDGLTWPTP
jgi:hypothetical protein